MPQPELSGCHQPPAFKKLSDYETCKTMKSLMEQINLSCLRLEARGWWNNEGDRSYRKLIHNSCQETFLLLTDRSKLGGLAHKERQAAEAQGKGVTHKTARCFHWLQCSATGTQMRIELDH